ncbi:MAG: hypothetical protein K2M76_03740, partial [Muribaculaceae bacterium]|nr:hypothetical protein [Muribaculaceae bacterium]
MRTFIKRILIAGFICGASPVIVCASEPGNGNIVIKENNRGDKQRDEIPVVNYDEDNETLTVSFEEMTYQGLV